MVSIVEFQALECCCMIEKYLVNNHHDIFMAVTEDVDLLSMAKTSIADRRIDISTIASDTVICGVGTV